MVWLVATLHEVLRCSSHVRLFANLWTVACQAPLSMGFSRQESRVGCHALIQGIFLTQVSNPHFQRCNMNMVACRPDPSWRCILFKSTECLRHKTDSILKYWVYVHAQSLRLCLTLRPNGLQPTRILCPWDSPGKNTGVHCHFLLQGIFPTWGSNPCLSASPALQVDSLPTEPPRKPR